MAFIGQVTSGKIKILPRACALLPFLSRHAFRPTSENALHQNSDNIRYFRLLDLCGYPFPFPPFSRCLLFFLFYYGRVSVAGVGGSEDFRSPFQFRPHPRDCLTWRFSRKKDPPYFPLDIAQRWIKEIACRGERLRCLLYVAFFRLHSILCLTVVYARITHLIIVNAQARRAHLSSRLQQEFDIVDIAILFF